MKQAVALAIVASSITTVGALGTWAGTGRHAYTKFQVVEERRVELPKDDPLVQAGFYDDPVKVETVIRDEFHLGLLPTPQGIFDKHLISVLTLVAPLWLLSTGLWWRARRRRRR